MTPSQTLTFVVPGEPKGKGRARSSVLYGRDGKPVTTAEGRAIVRHHTPQQTVDYEELIGYCAKRAMGRRRPLIAGAVSLALAIDCPVPASWSQRKQRQALAGEIYPTTKPDVDNVVKALLDGCNGVLWTDDVQVVDLKVRKRYSATPQLRVMVVPLEIETQQPELLGESVAPA